MKILITFLMALFVSTQLFAQWNTTSTTDPIWRTGYVSIGTNTPTAGVALSLEPASTNDWQMRLKGIGGSNWYIGSSPSAWAVGGGKLLFVPSSGASASSVLTLTQTSRVGVLNVSPRAKLDVGELSSGTLATVFGRLAEGDDQGVDGSYLGVRVHDAQPTNAKSFAIEHGFYGQINNSINFHRGGGTTGGFIAFNTNNNVEKMRILSNGSVCIGSDKGSAYRLAVEGVIAAREVNVNSLVWADYVFDTDYKLLPLEEVEKYIATNHHLPEVPSTAEVEKTGINLGEMNAILLKKIEELTLHMIEQEKRIKELESKR